MINYGKDIELAIMDTFYPGGSIQVYIKYPELRCDHDFTGTGFQEIFFQEMVDTPFSI